jgi:2-polyprenyl-3-methyl-5-hydroxy-6-metoxy-1,4-benzoquinol methylase
MSFSFGICKLPKHPELLKVIQSGCERLEKKLSSVDFKNLPITDYNKNYILQMIGTPDGLTNTMRKYAFVLSWALHKEKDFLNLTFLDYGAGHGLLSMLAAEIGIKNCIMSDIFAPSMDDAKVLAGALDLNISHFIVGDMDQTIEYLNKNQQNIDVVSNYDTIEHIYDINDFFR